MSFPDDSRSADVPSYTIGTGGLVHLQVDLSIEAFDAIQKAAKREGTPFNAFVARLLSTPSPGYAEPAIRLAKEIHDAHGGEFPDIFLKALTLYRVALDAEAEGNRVVIISPDDEIVHDVINIQPDAKEPIGPATPALEVPCEYCKGEGWIAYGDGKGGFDCEDCDGRGTFPTKFGEKVLDFLDRHWRS